MRIRYECIDPERIRPLARGVASVRVSSEGSCVVQPKDDCETASYICIPEDLDEAYNHAWKPGGNSLRRVRRWNHHTGRCEPTPLATASRTGPRSTGKASESGAHLCGTVEPGRVSSKVEVDAGL